MILQPGAASRPRANRPRGAGASGLPITFVHLTSLLTLSLESNKFTAVPKVVCRLSGLTQLSVANNMIPVLDAELGLLKQLKRLSAHSNGLQAVADELCDAMELEALDLSNNNLETLPGYICQPGHLERLSKLQTLDITGNMISVLPSGLGLLAPSLTDFRYDDYELSQLPSEVLQEGTPALLNYLAMCHDTIQTKCLDISDRGFQARAPPLRLLPAPARAENATVLRRARHCSRSRGTSGRCSTSRRHAPPPHTPHYPHNTPHCPHHPSLPSQHPSLPSCAPAAPRAARPAARAAQAAARRPCPHWEGAGRRLRSSEGTSAGFSIRPASKGGLTLFYFGTGRCGCRTTTWWSFPSGSATSRLCACCASTTPVSPETPTPVHTRAASPPPPRSSAKHQTFHHFQKSQASGRCRSGWRTARRWRCSTSTAWRSSPRLRRSLCAPPARPARAPRPPSLPY
jgi:hypothetical protein